MHFACIAIPFNSGRKTAYEREVQVELDFN